VAQELEAKALLLQSRLDDVQATAEMDEAIGRTPQLECFVADRPARVPVPMTAHTSNSSFSKPREAAQAGLSWSIVLNPRGPPPRI
jgi:hypothetical protein